MNSEPEQHHDAAPTPMQRLKPRLRNIKKKEKTNSKIYSPKKNISKISF
jgi:hypothetical protein